MSCYPSLETHPLKVSRLSESNSQKVIFGPPDVYQQEFKQKEDMLTEFNVREGFSYTKPVLDEYESAKEIGVEFVSKSFNTDVYDFMQAVIMKSQNTNTKPDTTKKKASITTVFKDLLYTPALDKSKDITSEWMLCLADTLPYSELINKRIPYFHKKEDVLMQIYRNRVPISRAIWYIKVHAMNAQIQAESSKKRTRPNVDSPTEWMGAVTKILSEKFDSIADKLSKNSCDHEYDLHLSEFEYFIRLLVGMYDEDLLEHNEVMQWIITKCENSTESEALMKFFLPFVLEFGDRFKESEILSRRLIFWACNLFNSLIGEDRLTKITDYYQEYMSCPLHRSVMLFLSGIITSLSLECPSAVVWNNVKVPGHYLNGSPLDSLPCSLTALPQPPGAENELIRDNLSQLEHFICQRSLHVENRWKHEAFSCSIESMTNNLIRVLEMLDMYDYNCCKDVKAMENLSMSLMGIIDDQQLMLTLLCEWAVTPIRAGTHRPFVVASIIEYLRKSMKHPIQEWLVQFLDTTAPRIDGVMVTVECESFRNLVSLYGELIDREIFSVNEYISYMIARGLFETVPYLPLAPIGGGTAVFSINNNISISKSPLEPDKLSSENPDSVRSEYSINAYNNSNVMMQQQQQLSSATTTIDYRQFSRHLQYLIHFPIPQNEDYSEEHNLRAQKLYHSSRIREQNKQYLRRLVKDICKLFSRRAYMFDIIQGEKPRKKSRKDSREESSVSVDKLKESIVCRFKKLFYYDMDYVLAQCLPTVVNSLNLNSMLNVGIGISSTTTGNNSSSGTGSNSKSKQTNNNMFLPHPKIINMVLLLIELSCNYNCLIQVIDECSCNVARLVEHMLRLGSVIYMQYLDQYCSQFRVGVIGCLVKHQPILMLHHESRNKIFQAFFVIIRANFRSPSVHRCTLAFLLNLYQSCIIIRSNGKFSTIKKMEYILYRPIEPDKSRNPNIEYLGENYASDLIKGGSVSYLDKYIEELQNNPSARLSFVVNCLFAVSRCQDVEQLVRYNTTIVDAVVQVASLPIEWMTGFFSLLMPFKAFPGYATFTKEFSILLQSNDLSVFDNISVLIATLIARHCFTFNDLLSKVICVAMAQGLEEQSSISPKCIPTTRLATFILHRLFTMESTVSVSSSTAFQLEDVNLLTFSLQKVTTEFFVDILKMLTVHSDKGRPPDSNSTAISTNSSVIASDSCNFDSYSYDGFGGLLSKQRNHRDLLSLEIDENVFGIEIWDLTLRVLREICCVPWVRIKFSMETPNRLIRDNVLIDKNISNIQVRNLLNIICFPREHQWRLSCSSKDITDVMTKTFNKLNLWSLHFDLMKVQLLLTQISQEDRKDIVESVSREIISLFHYQAEQHEINLQDSESDSVNPVLPMLDIESSYLIPPLINKLPFENFKRQLISSAAEKLESGKQFSTHKNSQDKEKDLTKSSSVLLYPPFISLLITCLSKDESSKADFLKSLSTQIEYFVENAKETDKMPDDLRVKHMILVSLRSRLALVGFLFDKIQDSVELSIDWCLLLSKLIIYGVVEMQSNHGQLFYTVLDMIGTLIHTLFAQPNVGPRFSNMIKKLRKEICDKLNYEGIELIKQFLLPCFRNMYDVVVTVPLKMTHKSLLQYRMTTNAEKSGKHGCAVQRKERLNPWEVIEGVRNLFSLSWFAAVSYEIPILPIEEQGNLMIGHDHSEKFIHPDGYYTSMPDIPQEDIRDQSESMEISNCSGPPSVPNNPSFDGSKENPGSVKVESIALQPLVRSHSNASTASSGGVSSAKRPKRSKRAANQSNMNMMQNSSVSRNITPPSMMTSNQGMMMRHPGMSIPTPNTGMSMSLSHAYGGHRAVEYGGYAHQINHGVMDIPPQHPGFIQRPSYPQSTFESVPMANIIRSNRMPRTNIVTQNLKSKIQQRQPQEPPMMHSFHNTQQQSIGLPPPYPGTTNPVGHDDISGVAPVPPPNYSSMTNTPVAMNSYSIQRSFPDNSMPPFMVQQQAQSRIHQQQYNRYNGQY